jgi:hypothetical protein
MALPMRCAAWNMVGAFISLSISPVAEFSMPSVSRLTTDWLSDRLPEEHSIITRSPGARNTWSLRKVEMLSRPALVRVSAIITSPSRTRTPQQ